MNSGHILGQTRDITDLHIEWRVHMALWAASHAKGLPGDFVECGVNTGIMSIAICTYLDFNSLDKDFYLFDTYCGIPEAQMSEDEREERIKHNESSYEECYDTAVRNFSPWPRCRLVRGLVPDTLKEVNITKVAYLHIDMNIAAPERDAMEFFWDKVVPGGVILLDDYGFLTFRPQYDSANEFARSKGVMIATLPTGQGLIFKR
jgi:O-methyltransferase